jgi:hypothetical protein
MARSTLSSDKDDAVCFYFYFTTLFTEEIMKQLIVAAIVLSAASTAAWAVENQGGNSQGGNNQGGNSQGGNYHGAPGPVVGAGLPVLAVGYGVYWLVKRRKKSIERKSQNA